MRSLDEVSSLDHDRILRSYLTNIRATLRTNYFPTDADGQPLDRLSLKMDPSAIPDLPAPRPKFEIFVYSPRVEGVHLRFGAVARGGLRWSDRRDDFRTEVLGPGQGADGEEHRDRAGRRQGRVLLQAAARPVAIARPGWPRASPATRPSSPACSTSPTTWSMARGRRSCRPATSYATTRDDPYLVVAADKGTATFSDIANGVSADYGFWLGDAFASGGSVGYDHKAMGITARGAWVSVRRHFREMGVDCQNEDFTCVGVGDMSGDVFGNGMLCSEHTRLVAAFDHRDIFVDPNPDAASSYAERKRLFDLPRSSWQDYDTR